MSNNKKPRRVVRDIKGQEQVKPSEVQVVPGNTAVLTVTLLNTINQSLIEIKQLLKEAANG